MANDIAKLIAQYVNNVDLKEMFNNVQKGGQIDPIDNFEQHLKAFIYDKSTAFFMASDITYNVLPSFIDNVLAEEHKNYLIRSIHDNSGECVVVTSDRDRMIIDYARSLDIEVRAHMRHGLCSSFRFEWSSWNTNDTNDEESK